MKTKKQISKVIMKIVTNQRHKYLGYKEVDWNNIDDEKYISEYLSNSNIWEDKSQYNNWRNYVDDFYKDHWNELTLSEQCIIFNQACNEADREYID
jgi:hypothetical protein